jgi:hypothetical protein
MSDLNQVFSLFIRETLVIAGTGNASKVDIFILRIGKSVNSRDLKCPLSTSLRPALLSALKTTKNPLIPLQINYLLFPQLVESVTSLTLM